MHDRADLDALVGRYDAVNIKLDKAGGLTEALALRDEAERLRLQGHGRLHGGDFAGHGAGVLLAQRADFVDLDGPLLLARTARRACATKEVSSIRRRRRCGARHRRYRNHRPRDRLSCGSAQAIGIGGLSEETVITWRAILSAIAAVAFCLPIDRSAMAQSYPARPVKIIVPFAPGGVDVTARVVADRLSSVLGQPFVVENRAGGAGGSIGAKAVAMAEPDGYTLLFSTPGPVTISPAVN